MGHQIIKQPDGMYALFSSFCDDFVLINAKPEDIVDEWVNSYKKEMEGKVHDIVAALERGEKPYYQFTMSFNEAVDKIKDLHGDNMESLMMLGITT